MAISARSRAGSTLLSIDRQCDEFESNWRAGKGPRIEEVLERIPAHAQVVAFRELLAIELELRRERGDTIRADEYRQRFADRLAIVDEVIGPFLNENTATTPISTSSDTAPNTATTCTRYNQLRFFRRGGLGALYRAFDETLHRETVVKFMNEQCEKDPSLVAQFKVEAEVTGRLDHPGIVPVYGMGQDWHGRPFYVMRLINGQELKQAIQEHHQNTGTKRDARRGRQSLFNLLEHLISASNTVAYAHHVGVVHCDLKPANIMIGKYGETFVLDWGLATNFERTTTFFSPNEPTMRPHSGTGGSSSGQRGGTYGYSSPEQLLTDGPIGPTSDVYSLGATLYEILTGQSPFNGRDPNVREQIRTGEFPLPRRLQPDLCPRLEAICLKAMSLSPHARYATAKLLADDITNWMRDEEIEATPDRWFDRLSRFGRRHRGITAAFFVTLITVILTAAWTDRTVKLAEHERENAANERALREKSDELRSAKDKAMQDEKQGFTIALDAFENLCRPFINGEMNNLGVFHRFVQTINNFTTEYLAKFQDNETMQIHTARVYELKATVSQINDNDVQSALKDLQLAEGIYRKLPPTAVERYARDLRLAQNHLSQGRLLIDTQNWDEAQRVCEATVVELRQLQSAQPASTEILRYLAEAHHYLGEVFLNRPGEGPVRDQALITSQGHFAESKTIREKLVSSTTGEESRNHIRDLARSTGYLGDLYLAQGDIPKALTAYQDSKERRAELYRTKSDDPEHRFQYARGLANFGRLERGYRGELTPAIKSLEQAAAIQQELMDDFPEMEKFALEFADTQNVLAEVYLLAAVKEPERKMEFHKLARESARKASDIFGRPDQQKDPSSVAALAQSLVCMALDSTIAANEAKQYAEDAEKQLRSLFPEQKLNSSELVTLAMARAMQGNIDGAMRALNMAVKRGENTAYRFQEHQQLAFKAIADDEEAAKELKALIGKIRDKLVF